MVHVVKQASYKVKGTRYQSTVKSDKMTKLYRDVNGYRNKVLKLLKDKIEKRKFLDEVCLDLI